MMTPEERATALMKRHTEGDWSELLPAVAREIAAAEARGMERAARIADACTKEHAAGEYHALRSVAVDAAGNVADRIRDAMARAPR